LPKHLAFYGLSGDNADGSHNGTEEGIALLGTTTYTEHDYQRRMVEAVSQVVSEPVVSAAAFNRRGLYTQKALGHFGFVTWLIARAYAKKQAGGLPQSFMLAITPEHVRAFEYKARGRHRDQYEIGDEVAVWQRSAIEVTWKNGPPYQTDVAITAANDGEQVRCRCGRGETTEQFLRILADHSASS
jgi:hypothetical protein